ncbi:unnamed protein product [Phaeothamnion confervicola]
MGNSVSVLVAAAALFAAHEADALVGLGPAPAVRLGALRPFHGAGRICCGGSAGGRRQASAPPVPAEEAAAATAARLSASLIRRASASDWDAEDAEAWQAYGRAGEAPAWLPGPPGSAGAGAWAAAAAAPRGRRRGRRALPTVISPMGVVATRRQQQAEESQSAQEQERLSPYDEDEAMAAANDGGDAASAPETTAAAAGSDDGAERRVRLSDPEAAYTHHVTLDVSLDRPVLPPPVSPFLMLASLTACTLAAVAVLARIPLAMKAGGAIIGAAFRALGGVSRALKLEGTGAGTRYRLRLWLGSLQAWMDRAAGAWERAFGPEEAPLPAADWSVCTLQERIKVGQSYLRYRFRLPQPNSVLPLGLAQEVTLCGLDQGDRVVAGSFCPLSPRSAMGYLEILVKKDPEVNSPEQQLVRLLDVLAIGATGDELAVRPGRQGLSYRGPYSPITDVVMVASGPGIVPMLQLVTELLPSRESSVNAAAVVWLNERADDFVLYSELENNFYKYHRKLDVSCIIERDLFGHQLAANPRVRDAVPEFKIGTLAVVAGPDYFVRKVQDYLSRQGYPEEVIIAL